LLSKGFERHSCFYHMHVKIKVTYKPQLKKKKKILNTEKVLLGVKSFMNEKNALKVIEDFLLTE